MLERHVEVGCAGSQLLLSMCVIQDSSNLVETCIQSIVYPDPSKDTPVKDSGRRESWRRGMSIKFLCSSHLDLGLHGLKIRDLLLHTPPTTFYCSCTHGCMDDLLWSSYTNQGGEWCV